MITIQVYKEHDSHKSLDEQKSISTGITETFNNNKADEQIEKQVEAVLNPSQVAEKLMGARDFSQLPGRRQKSIWSRMSLYFWPAFLFTVHGSGLFFARYFSYKLLPSK
jgi:hypothetical protein